MFIHTHIPSYSFFITGVICIFCWNCGNMLSIMEIKFHFLEQEIKTKIKGLECLKQFLHTHTHLYFTCSGLQYEPVKVSFEIISINLILQLNLLQSCQILLFIEDKIIFNCLWVEKQNNLWWYLEKRYLGIVYFN